MRFTDCCKTSHEPEVESWLASSVHTPLKDVLHTVQKRQEALAQCSFGVQFDPEGRRAMGHHDPGPTTGTLR